MNTGTPRFGQPLDQSSHADPPHLTQVDGDRRRTNPQPVRQIRAAIARDEIDVHADLHSSTLKPRRRQLRQLVSRREDSCRLRVSRLQGVQCRIDRGKRQTVFGVLARGTVSRHPTAGIPHGGDKTSQTCFVCGVFGLKVNDRDLAVATLYQVIGRQYAYRLVVIENPIERQVQ